MKIAQMILLGLAAVAAVRIESTEDDMVPTPELVEEADNAEFVELTDDSELIDLMEDADEGCHNYTKKQVEKWIKYAWKKYDKNKDGLISRKEACGRRPSKRCNRIFNAIDTNNTGYLAKFEVRNFANKHRC